MVWVWMILLMVKLGSIVCIFLIIVWWEVFVLLIGRFVFSVCW